MAHILVDRVRETTTTTGTGAISLAGAVAGYRDFDSVMANADTTLYCIQAQTPGQWEVGFGTWNTGNTLSRTNVLASSTGAAVNFSAGTKDVFMTLTPSGQWQSLTLLGGITVGTDLSVVGNAEIDGTITGSGGSNPIDAPQGVTTPWVVGLTTATTQPALELVAGTLMTTPADGAIEADATNFYGTTDAGNRGYIPIKHFIRAAANQTLTSTTNEQSFFDSPANGRVTLETGTYKFEWMGNITGMSATSGNARFDILGAGSATMTFPIWYFNGVDNTNSNTISADMAPLFLVDTTAASAVTAGTGTALRFWAQGMFEITGAGTVQPALALVTAAAATVQRGSFYMVERVGATGVVSVGQWD